MRPAPYGVVKYLYSQRGIALAEANCLDTRSQGARFYGNMPHSPAGSTFSTPHPGEHAKHAATVWLWCSLAFTKSEILTETWLCKLILCLKMTLAFICATVASKIHSFVFSHSLAIVRVVYVCQQC